MLLLLLWVLSTSCHCRRTRLGRFLLMVASALSSPLASPFTPAFSSVFAIVLPSKLGILLRILDPKPILFHLFLDEEILGVLDVIEMDLECAGTAVHYLFDFWKHLF